jgi:uncharacterized RDD family membrane protein YckC
MSVSTTRERRLYRNLQRKGTVKRYYTYPFWLTRLCSAGIDLGACGIVIGFLQHWFRLDSPLILLPMYAAYYTSMELWQGRTLGKMVFGLRLCTPSGRKPNKLLLILRTFLRAAGPIGFLMMLSWKRVTLLDLLTGMRVMRIDRLDSLGTPIRRAEQLAPSALGWR